MPWFYRSYSNKRRLTKIKINATVALLLLVGISYSFETCSSFTFHNFPRLIKSSLKSTSSESASETPIRSRPVLSSEVQPQLIQKEPYKRDNNVDQGRGYKKYSKKYNSTSWKNDKPPVSQRVSRNQNRKRRIRHLYSKARDLEKQGLWAQSCEILNYIVTELDRTDAHSYLAWGKLQSRRERGGLLRKGGSNQIDLLQNEEPLDVKTFNGILQSSAKEIFEMGTSNCPKSIHLWHGWAMHEQSLGNIDKARELLDKALEIDSGNGYVCHSYGLLEMQCGDTKRARQLWQQGLTSNPSAALICSLGNLYTTSGHPDSARELYSVYLPQLPDGREKVEVYLAASSLEETVFRDLEKASELLKIALLDKNVKDSRAYMALARLGTSGGKVDDAVVKKRLREICSKQIKTFKVDGEKGVALFPVKDGRLFNAWAKLESKSGSLVEAKDILEKGIMLYPKDHTLFQAAGNIEERLGNFTAARNLYSASLHIQPSAPTLVAYAMLELQSPLDGKASNITMVRRLFQEALLLEPKHGPAYNAFANLERRQGNVDEAKQIYQNGIRANCTDPSSVFHGLGKLLLSLGEVEEARNTLLSGLQLFKTKDSNTFVKRNENVAFLAHTLGLIELNCNNNPKAAKEILEQGLWHCRSSSQLLLGVALCESRLGNEQNAREMFEQAIKADESHAQAWQAFGVLEMRAGNYGSAKTLFECGLKNSPRHGALWQAYATLESRAGNVANARLLFAAGIQKCPKHVPLYQAWASLEVRDGDIITAKRLIGEALTRDKRNGSGWLLAAKIEEKMENPGLAGLILRRGIEVAPMDTELYSALAEHELNRGRIDSARELLEKAIEINPMHAPLYHSLAELEARVFNIKALANLNKRATEIFQTDATAPPSRMAMQAWSKKIKQGRTATLPEGIAALAEKVGFDGENDIMLTLEDVDPASLVERIGLSEDADGLIHQDY